MANADGTERAGERRQTQTDAAEQTGWGSVDTYSEVATVLRSKRWEQREGPFQGFDSPPGKF